MAAPRRQWTRSEALLVYRLYCEMPFGQMHRGNPRVVQLSEVIGRTASAVAMKLGNFAHLDPALQKRGIRGMSNVSAQDREIAALFASDWDASIEAAAAAWPPFADVQEDEIPTDVPTEVVALAKVRLTQGFFRRTVLSSYDQACCACGVDAPALLTASHIKPWAVDPGARSNPRNGLALCSLHDRAFDRGLMTIRPSLAVAISRHLASADTVPVMRVAFADIEGAKIRLPSKFLPDPAFLTYHNESVFRG